MVDFFNSKKFIRTGNHINSKVGSGGILIERKSGRHISFSSAYSCDENLKIYEKGYLKYEDWDIEITKISNLRVTVDALLKLKLSFVVPEEANGTIWKIPRTYKYKELKRKLAKLPVKFNVGNLYFLCKELDTLKILGCCEFKLMENMGCKNDI
ncbi:hypothetical protein BS333_17005 [Vibrio azureus]|uniref:Uncharacterized protein n=1 Tax=Vibrio azureus NBRC 104587 TaxID=1219077 RepID=U3CHF1_9VIBR|nr:hypothetical protein [Vibrio azureus]AUI88071.1 hypothetical protein BS333_17005 [Vibrio azureus]GAD77678.1 hypothetical protein VAZ01S_085_00240 [Vibrio azureus NBRC 104587]